MVPIYTFICSSLLTWGRQISILKRACFSDGWFNHQPVNHLHPLKIWQLTKTYQNNLWSRHHVLPSRSLEAQKDSPNFVSWLCLVDYFLLFFGPMRFIAIKLTTIWDNTVDGRNPAPVDRQHIPLFTRLDTSQVVSRISSINSMFGALFPSRIQEHANPSQWEESQRYFSH